MASSSNNNSSSSSTPPLCVKECGFYGNSATSNMCSKCYKDFFYLTHESLRLLKIAGKPLNVKRTKTHATDDDDDDDHDHDHDTTQEEETKKKMKNRCKVCNKRVGLTGFICRCGAGFFCGPHRYPDQHPCMFDHKNVGRFQLEKQLPLCRGDKLLDRA